jgi:hypothetical protein
MATKTKPKPRPKLTLEQMEIVGQMNDISFENTKLTFAQVVEKYGIKFTEKNGKLFRRECRQIFARERKGIVS